MPLSVLFTIREGQVDPSVQYQFDEEIADDEQEDDAYEQVFVGKDEGIGHIGLYVEEVEQGEEQCRLADKEEEGLHFAGGGLLRDFCLGEVEEVLDVAYNEVPTERESCYEK